jgi:hypothetical protein
MIIRAILKTRKCSDRWMMEKIFISPMGELSEEDK